MYAYTLTYVFTCICALTREVYSVKDRDEQKKSLQFLDKAEYLGFLGVNKRSEWGTGRQNCGSLRGAMFFNTHFWPPVAIKSVQILKIFLSRFCGRPSRSRVRLKGFNQVTWNTQVQSSLPEQPGEPGRSCVLHETESLFVVETAALRSHQFIESMPFAWWLCVKVPRHIKR
jgi:hypothetical protein